MASSLPAALSPVKAAHLREPPKGLASALKAKGILPILEYDELLQGLNPIMEKPLSPTFPNSFL